MIAMALCREHTNQSLPAIGVLFGGRDHTTVLHAVKRVPQILAGSEKVTADLVSIRHLLSLVAANKMPGMLPVEYGEAA